MKIKLKNNNNKVILDIVDYKSIIESYDIIDNKNSNFFFEIETICFIYLIYTIYTPDVKDKKTYLGFFNFMLNELSRARKTIKIPLGDLGKNFVKNFIYENYTYFDDYRCYNYYIAAKIKTKSEWDTTIQEVQNKINYFSSKYYQAELNNEY